MKQIMFLLSYQFCMSACFGQSGRIDTLFLREDIPLYKGFILLRPLRITGCYNGSSVVIRSTSCRVVSIDSGCISLVQKMDDTWVVIVRSVSGVISYSNLSSAAVKKGDYITKNQFLGMVSKPDEGLFELEMTAVPYKGYRIPYFIEQYDKHQGLGLRKPAYQLPRN